MPNSVPFLPALPLLILLALPLPAQEEDDGEGWVTHRAAISLASNTIAYGTMHAEKGTSWLVFRDLTENRERTRVPYSNPIRDMAFTPAGDRLATSQDGGRVLVFDPATGKEIARCEGHKGWVWSVAISPDGKRVASTGRDKTVRLWDLATGKEEWRKEFSESAGRLIFSADGAWLFVAHHRGAFERWDLKGEPTATLHPGPLSALSITRSKDGTRLATGQYDGKVRVWDTSENTLARTFEGNRGQVYAVALTDDAKQVAASIAGRTVVVWNAETGAELSRIERVERETSTLDLGFSSARGLIGASYTGETKVLGTKEAEEQKAEKAEEKKAKEPPPIREGSLRAPHR